MARLGLTLLLEVILIICVLHFLVQGENITMCQEGFFGQTTDDGELVCSACAECPPGTEVKAVCTNQSDTVCRSCERGTFSSGGIKCNNCSLCPPGSHVDRYCSLTSDTSCKPCAMYMYSSDWSLLNYCTPCSRCSRKKLVLKNCTRTQNYECGDCIKGYFSHPNLPSCMKCSYCYPDQPNVTFPMPECTTQSDDPNMRCMPVPGPPRERPLMFAGSNDNEMTSSTVSVEFMAISSTEYYSHDVLIPPNVSIPIIIATASSVILALTLVVIFKLKRRSGLFKKSRDLNRQRHADNTIESVLMNGKRRSVNASALTRYLETTSSDEEQIEENRLTIRIKVTNVDESNVDCDIRSPGVLPPPERTAVLESSKDEAQRCSCYAENEGFEEEEEGDIDSSKSTSPGTILMFESENMLTITPTTHVCNNDRVSTESNSGYKQTPNGPWVQSPDHETLLPRSASDTESRSHDISRDPRRSESESKKIPNGSIDNESVSVQTIGTGLQKSPNHARE